jgi:hypothetical protein
MQQIQTAVALQKRCADTGIASADGGFGLELIPYSSRRRMAGIESIKGKAMKTTHILLGTVGLVVAAAAFAWPGEPPPPPPPPPPELNDCSPGFWKNHTEMWVGIACTGSICDGLLADLTSKGPGSGELRHNAASDLNSWADGYYRALVCTD